MIDSYGRSLYQKVVIKPLLPFFSRVSPTTITFFAMLTGLLVWPLLAGQYAEAAFVMLMLSGLFDTLDGSVARMKSQVTPFGTVLDIIGDRAVEFSVVIGLYLYQPETRAFSCLFMLGSILLCVTCFLLVGIFTQNHTEKSFYYSPGLMERTEAFIFFGIMILVPSMFFTLSYLFITLVFLTTLIRLWQFYRFCCVQCRVPISR